MKVDNNSCLGIISQQLLSSRTLQFVNDLSCRRTHEQLILILQVHIYGQHVPAKQLLAIRSIKPERLDLALLYFC